MINTFCDRLFRRLNTRKIGNLVVGKHVHFENKGKIYAEKSYLGAINNVTVRIFSAGKQTSSFTNLGEFWLGDDVRVHKNFGIYIDKKAKLSIGDHTYINPEVIIICKKKINIGSDCAISWRCQFLDDDLHSIKVGGTRINPAAPIIIGNHVWVCSDVKILPGTVIEDGVIVAAGSVVKGKLDANCLYGGVPARKIREGVEWGNNEVEF